MGTVEIKMRGLRDISLGIAAALAIASLSVMPALAGEVAASPDQAVSQEKAVVPDAAPASTKDAAPAATKNEPAQHASDARAEGTKPPVASKKQAQIPLPPVRPVTLAQRHWSCWWCDRQMVLMLGIGY
jgi:hypothetical protein